MGMLDIVVASVVAQIVDGDSGADEVGKSEPFLDDLLGFGGGGGETWTVDDVDFGLGEQIEVSDKLLGLDRWQVRPRYMKVLVEVDRGRERENEEDREELQAQWKIRGEKRSEIRDGHEWIAEEEGSRRQVHLGW